MIVCRPTPSSSPATASISTTPIMAKAAVRPALAVAAVRESLPGKASAMPTRSPAAPAMAMANSSVVPWIVSHAASGSPSPLETNTARKAPRMQPL